MNTKSSLSIVVPVFNGAQTIVELIEALAAERLSSLKHVVLVVDGSPDDSLQVCRGLCSRFDFSVSVIELARNFGEHNAVMAGINHCDSDYIVTMDDDLQNPASEVRKLFEFAQTSQHDVVYAQYSVKEHAVWRNLGSQLTNWLVTKTQGKPKSLYLASFRCINRMVADAISRYTGPFPYVDGLILQATHNIGSIKVEHLRRPRGTSNYSLSRLLRLFSAILFNFSVTPLRVGAVAGGILALLGFLGFVVVIFEALFFSTPPGWATVAAAVFLLAGVQLVVLWLIGEYLGRIFLTANRKPQYVIRSITEDAVAPEALPRQE